jgi:hypothetical protein
MGINLKLSHSEIWETWNPSRLQLTPGPFTGLCELWMPSRPMSRLLLREEAGGYLTMGYVDEDTVFVDLEKEL